MSESENLNEPQDGTTGGVEGTGENPPANESALTPEQQEQVSRAMAGAGGPFGMGGYSGGASTNSLGLPAVNDPEKAYADMTRDDYLEWRKNWADKERELVEKAKTDTSLIDQAVEDAETASALTRGISDRNKERYGLESMGALTNAQKIELKRAMDRNTTLGRTQAVNTARIDQKAANEELLNDLINIGQGVNRSALSSMGTAAQNAAQLDSAYQQAKAASRANTFSTIGGLGAAAIFALAF